MNGVIAIVDYGVGNLRSVQKGLERVGAEAVITGDPATLDRARGIILPGVGAFGDAMQKLRGYELPPEPATPVYLRDFRENLRGRRLLESVLRQVSLGKPLLGICLGMQLLFEESEEMGRHKGLGLLAGRVTRFPEGRLKVPHMGWNQLQIRDGKGLLEGVEEGAYVYFVHSYYVTPDDPGDVLATTEYGVEFAAVVGRGSVFGAQFHPEKSQEVGLKMLENFSRIVGGGVP